MFSSLTRNAVDTMLWICKNQDQGPVTTESISKRLDLSISYLESMLSKLKKLNMLVSYRGPGGGYCTNGKACELKLIDIVRAFDFQQPANNGAEHGDNAYAASIDKNLINLMMQSFYESHLAHLSFADIMDMVDENAWGAQPNKMPSQVESRKFKPLQIHKLPAGPNSVFNLAASMSF